MKTRLLTSASALLALSLAPHAVAQDNDTETEAESRQETVIITATRRAESVQDVPLNIAAVGAEQIEQQGFTERRTFGLQRASLLDEAAKRRESGSRSDHDNRHGRVFRQAEARAGRLYDRLHDVAFAERREMR